MTDGHADSAIGLRARKKMERHAAIEREAMGLFASSGFDATTVDDIAAAAGIAPRTFFHYFETKEDVVLADHARRLERIIEELDRRPSGEAPWESLDHAFRAVAADYESEREQLAVRFTIMVKNPSVFARSLQLQAGWEESLTRSLHERIGHTWDGPAGTIAPRLLAASALAAMRSSLRTWLEGGSTDHLPSLVGRCFEQLAGGLDTAAASD